LCRNPSTFGILSIATTLDGIALYRSIKSLKKGFKKGFKKRFKKRKAFILWIKFKKTLLSTSKFVALRASLSLSKRISSAFYIPPPVPFGEAALREAGVSAATLN